MLYCSEKKEYKIGIAMPLSLTVHLRRCVSDFIGGVCHLLILHFTNSRNTVGVATNKLPDDLNSRGRAARLRGDDFAGFIDNEDAARCALGRLLQPDGRDECLCRVAQQCVREFLLRLEGSVCLGAVVGEAVDAVAGRSQGLVGVTEEAGLFSACDGIVLVNSSSVR
jgi:hypothetical protein